MSNVDRLLLADETINTGGEVVPWRLGNYERECWQEEAEAEGEAIKVLKQATEECFYKDLDGEYGFEDAGYEWDDYHGYCTSDIC